MDKYVIERIKYVLKENVHRLENKIYGLNLVLEKENEEQKKYTNILINCITKDLEENKALIEELTK